MKRLADRVRRLQIVRYGLAGLLSNAGLYALYLLLVWVGTPIAAAMTVAYFIGVAASYLLHGRWTFRHERSWQQTLPRYVGALGLGYLLNLGGLLFLVETLRWPHAPSQALMICVVAVALYLLQRYWVFGPHGHADPAPGRG